MIGVAVFVVASFVVAVTGTILFTGLRELREHWRRSASQGEPCRFLAFVSPRRTTA